MDGAHTQLNTTQGLPTAEHTIVGDNGFIIIALSYGFELEHAAVSVPEPLSDLLSDPPRRKSSGSFVRSQISRSTHSAPPLARANGLCDGRIFTCKIPPVV